MDAVKMELFLKEIIKEVIVVVNVHNLDVAKTD